MAFRFHVPCLPHTLPTTDYAACAYSQKLRNFARMMRARGHEVFLYESNEPLRPDQYLELPFNRDHPVWRRQNARAIVAMRENLQPHDILCLIGGLCQQPIAEAFPQHQVVEFGIGYYGVFAPFQVFESYAHRATVYGRLGVTNGRFFDAVIPNYFDPAEFPTSDVQDDYVLFVGRLNHDKGLGVAIDAAQQAGVHLIVCGAGVPSANVDYRGVVGIEERGRLMARARAVLAPTLYLEPFGGVAVEAQFCGTPAITTDWGAFPETVVQGVTGFRCHYLGEFVEAIHRASTLDRTAIRRRAIETYSLAVVGAQYERYFEQLALLWGAGWHTCA